LSQNYLLVSYIIHTQVISSLEIMQSLTTCCCRHIDHIFYARWPCDKTYLIWCLCNSEICTSFRRHVNTQPWRHSSIVTYISCYRM